MSNCTDSVERERERERERSHSSHLQTSQILTLFDTWFPPSLPPAPSLSLLSLNFEPFYVQTASWWPLLFIHCNSTWITSYRRLILWEKKMAQHIHFQLWSHFSVDPCISRATVMKDAPQPPPCLHTIAGYARPPSLLLLHEWIPPHPMAWRPTLFWEPKFWPSRKNQIPSD
jgi:hypothetical protein